MKNIKLKALLAGIPIVLGVVVWFGSNSNEGEMRHQVLNLSQTSTISHNGENFNSPPHLAVEDSSDSNAAAHSDISNRINSDDKDVRNKLVNLEQQLHDLQTNMNELMSKAQTQAGGATDPALQKQIADVSEQKEQLAYAYIESTFASEPVDPAWDSEVNSKISNSLAKIDSLSSSVVECATTMCRVNAVASGEEKDAAAVMHSLDNELKWEGQMRITVNHQSGETTAYLVRPGNALPEVTTN